MTSHYIHIGHHKFHYLKAGNGSKLLIAFHGYRNDASLFQHLVPYLSDYFTIVSVDLPHHGKTEWEGEAPMKKEILCELIKALMQEYNVEKIALLGYSIGGRVCLCVVENMPSVVEHCILVAADGLVFNPFYYFVTRNFMGKQLFRSFLSNDKNLHLIRRMEQLQLINSHKYRFVMHYLKTEQDRKKLQAIWNVLSLLIPSKNLKKIMNEYAIPVSVIMGKKDAVIPVSKAQKFIKNLPAAQLIVLNKGHRLLDEETAEKIANTLFLR